MITYFPLLSQKCYYVTPGVFYLPEVLLYIIYTNAEIQVATSSFLVQFEMNVSHQQRGTDLEQLLMYGGEILLTGISYPLHIVLEYLLTLTLTLHCIIPPTVCA